MWLLFCVIFAFPGKAQLKTEAQSIGSHPLSMTAYAALREKALNRARQQGWPIRKNYSNGRIMELQAIDSTGHPIYFITHNAIAAEATRTASVYTGGTLGLSLNGSSAYMLGKLGLWDGGKVLHTHQEFTENGISRIAFMNQSVALSDHATHLAGTLIARGTNTSAKGMAFGASLRVWDFTDDLLEVSTAASYLLVSNHAYGPVSGWIFNADRPGNDPNLKWEWWGNTVINQTEDYQFGFYTSRCSDLDRILFSNPYYLMVRSADNKHSETGPPAGTAYYLRNTAEKSTLARSRNDGYDVIAGEATAKNVLTVGSGEVTLRNNQPISYSVASYSGWGPTDDGRIKPDLLGAGTRLLSPISSGNTTYGINSGTSMASANVTGSLFLLQELYARMKVNSRNEARFMRAATLKGLVIHTADRFTTAGATQNTIGPDYRQGWGMLNVERAASVILNDNGAHRLEEQTLLQGGTYTLEVTAQGNEPLWVTLCWTDPEGMATSTTAANVNNRSPKLVNDLDIRIIDNGAAVLPWVLDPNQPNLPAYKGDNVRDNVEQVLLPNPVAGRTYTIIVRHKGQLRYNAQPFSLIISGLQRKLCQLSVKLLPDRDTSICAGDSLTLWSDLPRIASSGSPASGLTYEWIRNGSIIAKMESPSYQISQPGIYSLRITDLNGCVGQSLPIVVQQITPTAYLSPAEDQWLCASRTSVRITASAETGTQFEWLRDGQVIPNVVTGFIDATEPGLYQLRLRQQGCQATTTSVSVKSISSQTIVMQPEDLDIALPQGASVRLQTSPNKSFLYQWFQDGQLLQGATSERLLVNTPGQYQVRVSQQSCAVRSSPQTVRWADKDGPSTIPDSLLTYESADSTILLYPNPASTVIHIKYSRPIATQMWLSIIDELGRIRKEPLPMQFRGAYFEINVDINDLPVGYYVVRITGGYRPKSIRFLKK